MNLSSSRAIIWIYSATDLRPLLVTFVHKRLPQQFAACRRPHYSLKSLSALPLADCGTPQGDTSRRILHPRLLEGEHSPVHGLLSFPNRIELTVRPG